MIKDILLKNWVTTVLGADLLVGAICLGFNILTPGVAVVLLAVAGVTLMLAKDK